MTTLTPVPPLTLPTDWIPAGRYIVHVVDGLDAYWAQVNRKPDTIDITAAIGGRHAQVPPHVAAYVIERLTADPTWPLREYGKITGHCGKCWHPVDEDPDLHGAHPECVPKTETRQPHRDRARAHIFGALLAAWRDAPADRRLRAVTNTGPIIMEKLDATAARAEADLPAIGMPTPPHTIRNGDDPRIPAWVASLTHRLSALNDDQFSTAFHWVGWDDLRHFTVDLATAGAVVHGSWRLTMAQVRARLIEVATEGQVLYASLKSDSRPMLTVTLATDREQVAR